MFKKVYFSHEFIMTYIHIDLVLLRVQKYHEYIFTYDIKVKKKILHTKLVIKLLILFIYKKQFFVISLDKYYVKIFSYKIIIHDIKKFLQTLLPIKHRTEILSWVKSSFISGFYISFSVFRGANKQKLS